MARFPEKSAKPNTMNQQPPGEVGVYPSGLGSGMLKLWVPAMALGEPHMRHEDGYRC